MKTFLQFLLAVFFLANCAVLRAQEEKNPVVENLYTSAEKHADAGEFDQAIADYEKILKLAPKDPDAFYGRGFAYLGKKDYATAIADFTKTLEIKPDDFYTYYTRGKAYFLKGDYKKSIEDHTREVELEELRDIGRLERGNALIKLNRASEALPDFNRAIAFADLTAAFYSRGAAFQALGDKPAAIADLRSYLERIPDDAQARDELVKLGANPTELPAPIIGEKTSPEIRAALTEVFDNLRQAYYNEAVFGLTKIIKSAPNFAPAYFYRGYALEMQASELNGTKILADYTKAIALDPKFTEAYVRRAYRGFFGNARAKSLIDLNRAIALDPKSARAFYYRGMYFNGLEKWANALTDFNQAIKLNPYYTDAYLTRGDGFENLKQYDKAIADYTQAIKINANDTRGYQGRAKVYCEQNKKDLAAADNAKIIELGGKADSTCE